MMIARCIESDIIMYGSIYYGRFDDDEGYSLLVHQTKDRV